MADVFVERLSVERELVSDDERGQWPFTIPCVAAIARDGLRARGRRDATGADEAAYLAPLETIAAGGPTQAEYWLARYRGEWHGDVRRILAEAAI